MSSTAVVTIIERERVDAINLEHSLCERASADAFTHALECGRMLAVVKEELAHGDWKPWVEDHFEGSYRSARVYMQLAGSAEIENWQDSASLPESISAALEQVSKPKAQSRVSGADVVRGLEDDDEAFVSGLPAVQGSSLEGDGFVEAEWTGQHERNRARILETLGDVYSQLEHASDEGLLDSVRADKLRDAERKAREVGVQCGNLAFMFEQRGRQ